MCNQWLILIYYIKYKLSPSHARIHEQSLSIEHLLYVFIELFQRISIGASTPMMVSPDDKILITACINPNLAKDNSLSSG